MNDNFKKALLIFLCLFIILVPGYFISKDKVKADEVSGDRSLTVNGEGIVRVVPDIAVVSLGVWTLEKTASEAQAKNNSTASAVISRLISLGISKDDIKTTGYSLYPEYQWDEASKRNVLVGYRVTNNIEIKLRDINKVGTVIDEAVKLGVNQINGVNFEISDVKKYYLQALEMAVKDGQDKANVIAKASGINILLPNKITENGLVYTPIYRNGVNSEAGNTTDILPGIYEIKASVTLIYKY